MKLASTLAFLAFAPASFALAAPTAAAQPGAGRTALAVTPETPVVNIIAEGRSDRVPDLAMFNAGVVAQGRSAGEAMSANTARMNAVLAAIRGAGVERRDIQTSALSLQPQYHHPSPAPVGRRPGDATTDGAVQPQPPRIIGYEARNTVSVRLRDVAGMGRLIDALVAAGANQVDGPYFSVEQSDAAADEARADALRKARARAELYAREAGFRTVRLLTINEGGGSYPMAREVGAITVTAQSFGGAMASPPPPPPMVQPGQVAVGVTLSVQFALER
ncbi:SIMPL domain-containing protein [Phenylobacterium sp.]|uniref:SIMPL domain-containing protein n=1 Tax=Phenylobacterium sp. TaxID=1871053 RepID=UPI00301CBEA8